VAAASGPVGQEMRRSHPDIVLRVHVEVPQNLITHVAAGLVDIAIMYAPQHRLGLEIDLLMEEELVLVTTDLTTYDANDPRYVHVEWRPDFFYSSHGKFSGHDPEFSSQSWSVALNYIHCWRVVLATSEGMRFSPIWNRENFIWFPAPLTSLFRSTRRIQRMSMLQHWVRRLPSCAQLLRQK
jgi:DNA-binding transcriptional LysR family regulator